MPPGGRGYCEVRENRDGVVLHADLRQPVRHPRRPDREEALLPLPSRRPPRSRSQRRAAISTASSARTGTSRRRGPEELSNYDLPPGRPGRRPPSRAAAGPSPTPTPSRRSSSSTCSTARSSRETGDSGTSTTRTGSSTGAAARAVPRTSTPPTSTSRASPTSTTTTCPTARSRPVLRSLRILKEEGVHLEITTLLVPGRNDDPETLRAMCRWIRDNLGASVPLHFSRFHPQHRLTNLPPTPVERLEAARDIALAEGPRVRLHRERARTRGEQHLLPGLLGGTHPQDRLLRGGDGRGGWTVFSLRNGDRRGLGVTHVGVDSCHRLLYSRWL